MQKNIEISAIHTTLKMPFSRILSPAVRVISKFLTFTPLTCTSEKML
jgi:hypothetical protein